MEWLIPLFPASGGLGQSVITCVWIGIAVVAFFNLRFGFPLTGLVVPGYLVPLFIISPTSAWVIIIEAVMVYALMRWLAKSLLERLGFAEMFGRDRFFAIVLLSILVRVVMDVVVWPWLGGYLSLWDITFDYANQLYSLGLIIIALTANVMWNSGFWYGAKVTAIQLLVTYLIIRFGLIAFTNFNIANLAVMYEAVAASIIAAPKAYIILIITAFIASRANLKYGWEFNGIMLPALLALQLMQPTKLLTSLIETAIILCFGYLLLTFTRLKHAHIEGARLILLFFNIGFVYKLLLNYAVIAYFPSLKVTDTFAFGYMLSTLLALKIYQKNTLGLVLRATFQTSIVGGFIAICIGFIIMTIPTLFTTNHAQLVTPKGQQTSLSQTINDYQSRLYTQSQVVTQASQHVYQQQRHYFRQAIMMLNESGIERYVEAADLLARANFSVRRQGAFIVIEDNQQQLSRGLFVINLSPQRQHSISVPFPTSERTAAEASEILLQAWQSKALALGSAKLMPDGQSNTKQSAFYQDFFAAMANTDVVQLRELTRHVRETMQQQGHSSEAQMWIYNRIPESVQQTQIRQLFTINTAQFGIAGRESLPFSGYPGNLVEVYLDSNSYSSLLAAVEKQSQTHAKRPLNTINMELTERVAAFSEHISAKGSGQFQLLSQQQAALWEFEVIKPLLSLSQDPAIYTSPKVLKNRLQQINETAGQLAYQVELLSSNSGQYVVLAPQPMPTAYALGQGMYVIALGAKDDLTIAVPRPLFESNTLQFASQLMFTTQAKLLLIAGAHPEANAHANVLSASNITTLFNVVHQSTQRFYQHSALLNLQIRSHSAPSAVRPSALALQNTFIDERYQSTVRRLQDALSSLGVTTQLVQGQQATRGLELGTTPQSGYQLFTTHSEQAALWLAADYKSHFAQSQEVLKERLLAISETLQLASLNLAALAPSDWAPAPTALLSTLQSATAKYAQEHNLPALYNVCVKAAPDCRIQAFETMQFAELGLAFYISDKLAALYFPKRDRVIDFQYYQHAVSQGRYVLD
ncbi:poly-gamma-glutamate biosynthesis protein PgsC/CapC [Pseudoalteromonas 'SMAR']|uniref:poly-gamma-glutamate biosynthesis protein PgsC/CapC n=1 Tax=Pseudoalteromonas 'SMAR' TaxID=3416908 RepID=UPI003AF2F7D1